MLIMKAFVIDCGAGIWIVSECLYVSVERTLNVHFSAQKLFTHYFSFHSGLSHRLKAN